MIYVLDTNIIRTLLNSFPKKGSLFKRIWDKIDEKIADGELISTDECYNELKRQFSEKTEEYSWFNKRKKMFMNPTNQESIIIKNILVDPKMRETVHLKNILENRPSADIYIVAKAKALGATVVTKEKHKPNSAQLPDICKRENVQCISFDDFMEIISEN